MYPMARRDGLTVKQMGEEAVVFDAASGNVHHLNKIAEVVWRSCDGRTDPAGLARIVSRVSNVEDAAPAVELALEQLSRRGLLSTNVERADEARRRDRRVVLKNLAKAMCIPLVMTVTAGQARARTLSYCLFPCPGTDVFVDGVVVDGFCLNSVPCPPPFFVVVV